MKTKFPILKELISGITALFLGDLTSKIGWAVLSLIIGIVVLIRPVLNHDGIELKKSAFWYITGSILLLLSICLVFSWLRQQKANKIRE